VIRILHSTDTGEKMEVKRAVHQLLIDIKKVYDSVRREILYNILIELLVPMKLVRLIEISLNETYSKVRIYTNFADNIPIQNELK
jgi:hypothetical protein